MFTFTALSVMRWSSRRSASTSVPDLPITIPGRAVWMLTSTSFLFFLIVMLERPACESLLSMCSRMWMSSSR